VNDSKVVSIRPGIVCYAIYKHPLDYPENYVVRKWDGLAPDVEPLAVVDTLATARAALPSELTNIGRYDEDDACLVEVWV
jgi:hypothetical protein